MGKAPPGNLVLTGFSFTGKSVVGREVARRLGWRFLDTDERIEEMAGRPIPDIFAQEGEAAFRALERRALEAALAGEEAVVATGGGAAVAPENRALMERQGLVICLEARPETIYERLKAASSGSPPDMSGRPLLAGPDPLSRIRDLKASRQPCYALARWTVHTDALTPQEVAGEVLRAWEVMGHRAPEGGTAGAACLVTTATGSYPVWVGCGLLGELGQRLREIGLSGRALVVADSGAWPHYQDRVMASLEAARFPTAHYVVPQGEASKTLATARALYSWLVRQKAERGDALIALGGGVVGDLAGFVAATYLRGLPFVQVPTTLAAMADASIGGKVAVNLPQAKNLVGAFYQPRLVLADLQTLTTLPPRELTSGWAEVSKHGLVLDPALAQFLEARAEELLALEPQALEAAISWSARLKGGVVSRDEREAGERSLLNYGHTVGHALEVASGYGRFLHGEAVSLGMMAAAHLSHRLGLAPASLVERHQALLLRFGLPVAAAGIKIASLFPALKLDKKVRGQSLRWVLLADVGQPVIREDVPLSLVKEAVRYILKD